MRYYQPFPAAIPLYEAGYPRVTHPSATQSQISSSEESKISASFDLHVLSTPPAFILSQDQTLVKNVCIRVRIAWQFCSCLLFWFDIFRCPFLKNLFKEFSGSVVYCSVINVLFVVAVSCDSFYIISKCFMFVNNFFISFFAVVKQSLTRQLI